MLQLYISYYNQIEKEKKCHVFLLLFFLPQQEAPVDSTCLVSGWLKMSYKGGLRFLQSQCQLCLEIGLRFSGKVKCSVTWPFEEAVFPEVILPKEGSLILRTHPLREAANYWSSSRAQYLLWDDGQDVPAKYINTYITVKVAFTDV